MNAALFAYSRRGCATARRVMAALADWDIQPYTMERFAEDGFAPLGRPAREFYGPIFGSVQAMIFVSSVGLAVREVAPHLKSKATDPAVLVLDELGQYVIPVLSGHIGGANELAKALAASLGAQALSGSLAVNDLGLGHAFSWVGTGRGTTRSACAAQCGEEPGHEQVH